MNVEGFKWYNPTVKKQKKPSDEPRTVRHSVSPIENVCDLARIGMRETDEEIIRIMIKSF